MENPSMGGYRDGTPDPEIRRLFNEIVAEAADVAAAAVIAITPTDGVRPPAVPTPIDKVDPDALLRKIHDQYPGRGHQY